MISFIHSANKKTLSQGLLPLVKCYSTGSSSSVYSSLASATTSTNANTTTHSPATTSNPHEGFHSVKTVRINMHSLVENFHAETAPTTTTASTSSAPQPKAV